MGSCHVIAAIVVYRKSTETERERTPSGWQTTRSWSKRTQGVLVNLVATNWLVEFIYYGHGGVSKLSHDKLVAVEFIYYAS